MSIHLSLLHLQTATPWKRLHCRWGDNGGTNTKLRETNRSVVLLFIFHTPLNLYEIRKDAVIHSIMYFADNCIQTSNERQRQAKQIGKKKAAVAFSEWKKKNPYWSHYHNSGKHAVALSRAHYHELHSWHPTATTGTTLWLIKVIEPLKCARFSEEQRVIWKQAHRKNGLQTCWRKTSQHSLHFEQLFLLNMR